MFRRDCRATIVALPLAIFGITSCAAALAGCAKPRSSSPTQTPLRPYDPTPGERPAPPPTTVADARWTPERPARIATIQPPHGDQPAIFALWDAAQTAPLLRSVNVDGGAIDRGANGDGVFVAVVEPAFEALPTLSLRLLAAQDMGEPTNDQGDGRELCRIAIEGTGTLHTRAMAAAKGGLAWVGDFTGALGVGGVHLVAEEDVDGAAVFLTRDCKVTGAIRLAGDGHEGMALVLPWPDLGSDTSAPTSMSWLVVGHFSDRALWGLWPLEAAHKPRNGLVHSLAVARIDATGKPGWIDVISSPAPIFATTAALSPGGAAVALGGSAREALYVQDAASTHVTAAGPSPTGLATAHSGVVWQVRDDGTVLSTTRAPYLGTSDVNGIAYVGDHLLATGRLRGAADAQAAAHAFGVFTARLASVRDAAAAPTWQTIALLPTIAPIASWLTWVEGTRAGLLLQYDGKAISWQAARVTPAPAETR